MESTWHESMLYDLLPPGFSVKTYRVSYAQTGSKRRGSYFGVVRCRVRRGVTVPLLVEALGSAGKEYRSKAKADAEADARFTDRIRLDVVGGLKFYHARHLLSRLFHPDVSDPLIYFDADEWIMKDLGASSAREAVQKFGLAEQILSARALYQITGD